MDEIAGLRKGRDSRDSYGEIRGLAADAACVRLMISGSGRGCHREALPLRVHVFRLPDRQTSATIRPQ